MLLLAALALTLDSAALSNSPDDEDEVYPVEFQGSWAPSLGACRSEYGRNIITIGKTKIWTYEADSKLLKITPEIHFSGPKGTNAKSVHAVVAERGETEVGIGKLRLTLAGGRLFTSRLDEVSEDEQWEYPNVRCP